LNFLIKEYKSGKGDKKNWLFVSFDLDKKMYQQIRKCCGLDWLVFHLCAELLAHLHIAQVASFTDLFL
jgi:hypothetical protein